jgi:hypothetical protein
MNSGESGAVLRRFPPPKGQMRKTLRQMYRILTKLRKARVKTGAPKRQFSAGGKESFRLTNGARQPDGGLGFRSVGGPELNMRGHYGAYKAP